MQIRVRQRFAQLQQQDERTGQVPWHVVNAAGTIEQVQKEINEIVEATIDRIHCQKDEQNNDSHELPKLWQSVIPGDDNKENSI